jgi:hypothetical protein
MTDNLAKQFTGELRGFFMLSLLNIVYAAMAMAFGIWFIVTSIPALGEGETTIAYAAILIILGGATVLMGIRWILASVQVFSGIKQLRDEWRSLKDPIPDETLTGMIIRMISYYRGNRKTIQTMIVTGIFCGFFLLMLAIIQSLEFLSFSISSGTFSIDVHRVIPLTFPAYFVAVVSLFTAAFFKKYSTVWDLRQQEIDQMEEKLHHVLEQG